MGQSVTIACQWSLTSFSEFFAILSGVTGAHLSVVDEQLQLVESEAHWRLVLYQLSDEPLSAAEEYSSNEDIDQRFLQDLADLRFYIVRFNQFEVARQLLRLVCASAVARRERLWIDTDYGCVIHSADFLQRLEADPAWDWRTLTPWYNAMSAPEDGDIDD